jgi:molybdopterin-guanine dinucleotide biosynthesis protein A
VQSGLNPLAGIILCGGQSSRMGRPKAWLPFGDELMLPRVVRILSAVCHPLVVVAAPDQDLPPLPTEVIITRDEEKGRGPLQGLAAGLGALAGKAEAAYVSSCDVPFLKPAFVQRMAQLRGGSAICVPKVGGFHHPLAAVYQVGVLPVIRSLLAENRLRPLFLFDAVPTRVVEEAELGDVDPGFESLRNLNTPEDYEAAVKELTQRREDAK